MMSHFLFTTDSLEKCKRRWRQLRNDYTRWCNADANRRRSGQRRLAYPLADELRFLDRHLNLADDIVGDDDRSVASDKDRDSTRDSDSRDHHPQPSSKERAASTSKLVKDAKLAGQVRKVKSPQEKRENLENLENHEVKQQAGKKTAEEELAESEESDEPEKVPELDSFLQSDNEGDECVDEEHLEDLEGFDFDLEQSNQEKELTPEKSLEKDKRDSPASQLEFFVKQSKDPRLLIIGKKNSTTSLGEPDTLDSSSGDPLGKAMEDSGDEYVEDGEKRATSSDTISPSRRPRRAARASISAAGIRDLPIQKPGHAQRMTRLQRRKSMSLAAVHSVRSSTSPVKMTPVPRSQPIIKPPSGAVQIRKMSHRDDIFPRPAVPAGSENKSQIQPKTQQQQNPLIFPKSEATTANPQDSASLQRRPVGRPPKKLPVMQRMVLPQSQTRPQSPINSKLLTVSKPTSSAASGGSNINNLNNINKSNSVTSISSTTASTTTSTTTSTITKATTSNSLKPAEKITVTNYSPSSSTTSSSGKPTSSTSGTVVTTIPTTTTAGSPAPGGHLKNTERSTQTRSQDAFSDDHFLEMIKPQMQEMNARQKMHFKKKVFQALMETFDDATDFPTSREMQHFNINTPSGFEHVTDPELRLVRELVSMVSAAKVTQIRPPGEATATATLSRSPAAPDMQRGPRPNMPRQVIQRVYKPGTGLEIATQSPTGGQEKKLYRILQMSGKPNGNMSASLENLRKESVDSNHSSVRVASNAPIVSPKGAAVVAAVRPQGSMINSFFGQGNGPPTAKGAAPVKVRAMSRRYSVCGSSNPPNAPNTSQSSANISSINQSNLSGVDASMLKRRLIAPGHGMVPPTQRPRYSAVAASQMAAASQGSSLLVRKSVGCVTAYQKQISPTSVLQKTPQIASVQGSAFNDFVQPKPSVNGEGSSPSSGLKRSLVVANTKTSFQDLLQQPSQSLQRKKKESSETAATIAADDFSLASLKREPVDSADDHDDLLGI
ncbi:cell wall protein DAN4 isoform X2 [Drosophila teissieri]|uniref:cell wall protein DAN4 isoform X2 n=1 Tax=Drosophila teissieri TaxID=7243 RepID=UPI001CB9F000|nr:cell wall protein DAN4 isoform X2 [Drosophila teissieri]